MCALILPGSTAILSADDFKYEVLKYSGIFRDDSKLHKTTAYQVTGIRGPVSRLSPRTCFSAAVHP